MASRNDHYNGALELKGSHSMGDRRFFLKIRRDASFKKGLSNEPTFGLIHLILILILYSEDPSRWTVPLKWLSKDRVADFS
jgi:hypothetical protein